LEATRDNAHNPTAKLGVGGLQLFHMKRIGSGLGVDVGEARIVLVYDYVLEPLLELFDRFGCVGGARETAEEFYSEV
jgi:hypothetical protein